MSFFFFVVFLLLSDAGGEGLLSPAAWAALMTGAASSAVETMVSIKNLIPDLRMHLSRFWIANSTPKPEEMNTRGPETFPVLGHNLRNLVSGWPKSQ